MKPELTRFQIWMLAIRPKTLPATVGPVIIGVAFSFNIGQFRILPSIAAFIGALLLQILSNLSNDYYDFIKGKDTEDRIGPVRVAQSGLMSLKELKTGILVNIVLAVISGLYIIYEVVNFSFSYVSGGLIILGIGVLSIIFAILYSGGPFPLSSLGLGDLFVFIFFGIFAVNGTYFVNVGEFSVAPLIGSVSIGLLITGILVVNNYRDYESDKKNGKNTLVVRYGLKFGLYEFYFCLTIPFLVPLALFLLFPQNFSYAIYLPLLAFPFAYELIKKIRSETEKRALNKRLAQTALLGLVYSILIAIGIILKLPDFQFF